MHARVVQNVCRLAGQTSAQAVLGKTGCGSLDPYGVTFDAGVAHLGPHVRVDGEHEHFDEEASIQRHSLEIDRLRFVIDRSLARDRKTWEVGRR